MNPRRLLRGVSREAAKVLFVTPAQHWRRHWLIVKLKFAAMMTLSTTDVRVDKSARIGRRIIVEQATRKHTVINIGPNCKIGDGVRFKLYGGLIDLRDTVDVRSNCIVSVADGELVLEGPNNLGWGVAIHCSESIYLERFAHVAEYSTLVDNSHYYTSEDEWSYRNTKTAPVRLGKDVWVCPKSTITSGVSIGDHTIIAANTVVTKDAPPGVLVSGVPGKIVKDLDQPWRT